MKKSRILNAMDYISDDKITSADEPIRKKSSAALALTIIGACAAEAAVVMLISSLVLNSGIIGGNVSVSNESGAHISAVESIMSSAAALDSDPYESGDYSAADSVGCESGLPGANNFPEFVNNEMEYDRIEDYDDLPFECDINSPEKIPYPEILNFASLGDRYLEDENEDPLFLDLCPLSELRYEKLPVFRGYNERYFRLDDVLPTLEKYAAVLGEPLTDIEYTEIRKEQSSNPLIYGDEIDGLLSSLTARAGDTVFTISEDEDRYSINIVGVPDDTDLRELLGYDRLVYKSYGYGAGYHFYDRSDIALNNFLNYEFNYSYMYENNITVYNAYNVTDCIGMYRVLTPEEALERLRAGIYDENWRYGPNPIGDDEQVVRAKLFYLPTVAEFSADKGEEDKWANIGTRLRYEYQVPMYFIYTKNSEGKYKCYEVTAVVED